VLIDAPCSGSGVIRRNPENKWNLTEDAIKTLTILQENILHKNAGLVKRNGVLVYATCSIIAEENEKIIQEFLKGNQEFELVAEKKLVPGLSTNYDGFYMAKMVRRV
jgi:16S rRNA (cytosine967-C5)-methyltransferase